MELLFLYLIAAGLLFLDLIAAVGWSQDGFSFIGFLILAGINFLVFRGIARRRRERREKKAAAAAARSAPASPLPPVGSAASRAACEDARVSVWAMSRDEAVAVQDYVALDVETTGLSPETDQIIEVAALRSVGGELTTFATFVRPTVPVPYEVTKLTGIRDKDVRSAPEIVEVAWQLAYFIGDLPIVAHNASFDAAFLARAFGAAGVDKRLVYIDTVSLARFAFPGMENYKLATLIRDLGLVDEEQRHRAGSDTVATMNLFELCRKEIPSRVEQEKQWREEAEARDRERREAESRAREQALKIEKANNLNMYGTQAEAAGNVEKAIMYYEDALSEGVAIANPYMRLSVLYRKQHRWADVVRVCDAAMNRLSAVEGKSYNLENYEKRKAYALAKLDLETRENA